MTEQHLITPPPELVRQWAQYQGFESPEILWRQIATQAARWGADQQLAKDAKWLDHNALSEPHLKIIPVGESLKEAMRPKPPSLKEQALQVLANADGADHPVVTTVLTADQHALIRKALEQLND